MAIAEIAGNSDAKAAILSAARPQKGGAAYMFTGEENVGKNFAALQFAKALNCLEPKNGDCCDLCANCRIVEKVLGSLDESGFQTVPHPDATYINTEKSQLGVRVPWIKTSAYDNSESEAESKNEVKLVDILAEFNAMRAIKLKNKIVMIQDADRLNEAVSNTILKELEEPGADNVIILIVNNQDSMLPTITSRCKEIVLRRASAAEIEKTLRRKDPFADDEAVKKAVDFADGIIGDAIRFEEVQKVVGDAVGIFKAVALRGAGIEPLFDQAKYIEKRYKEEQEKEEKKKMKGIARRFLVDILKILAHIFRDMLAAVMDGSGGYGKKYGIEETNVMPVKAGAINAALKRIERAQRDLLMNANVNLLFTELLFKLRKEVQ